MAELDFSDIVGKAQSQDPLDFSDITGQATSSTKRGTSNRAEDMPSQGAIDPYSGQFISGISQSDVNRMLSESGKGVISGVFQTATGLGELLPGEAGRKSARATQALREYGYGPSQVLGGMLVPGVGASKAPILAGALAGAAMPTGEEDTTTRYGEKALGALLGTSLGVFGKLIGYGPKIVSTVIGRPLKLTEKTLIEKVKSLGESRLNELSTEEKATLKNLADEQAAAERKLASETERKTTAEKTAAKAKGTEERAVGGLAGTRAAEEFGQYGIVPMTKTKIGENLRTMVDNFVSSIKEIRKAKADAEFPSAFQAAAAREAAGEKFINTPQMQALKKAIDSRLKSTTDRTLANNLEKLRDSLFVGRTETSMTPTVGVRPTGMFPAEKTTKVIAVPTFKSAEDIRRFLGDAASGVTAEGYEAIGQNLARDLYGQLSDAMKSFSPKFGGYLERYKDLSKQIESAGTKLGKALIGVEKDAPGYYAVDASKVADRAFSSPESIATLIDAMGGNKQPVMAMAERYFANEIAGKTTEQARKFLTSDKVRSLLDELGPEFRSRIENRYFTRATEQSRISEAAQGVIAESKKNIDDLTKKINDLSSSAKTTKENISKLKSDVNTGLERIRVAVSDADRTKNATDLLASLKEVLPTETYAEAENLVTRMKEAANRQSEARKLVGSAIGLGSLGTYLGIPKILGGD